MSLSASLHVMQLRVATVFANQLIVCAVFDNATSLDRNDSVGMADRRQTMSDQDHGSVLNNFLHILLNDPLALIIESARGLVEDQNAWIRYQRPSNCDA